MKTFIERKPKIQLPVVGLSLRMVMKCLLSESLANPGSIY